MPNGMGMMSMPAPGPPLGGAPMSAPAPQAAPPAPAPGPAAQPAQQGGMNLRGRLGLQIAVKILNQTISMLSPGSDEWKDAMKALGALGPYGGGEETAPLQQTEMRSMMAGAPPIPAVTPSQRQAFQQAMRSRMMMRPPTAA